MMARTKEEVVQEFRVQTIREAAAQVIAREGLGGASMQAIAKEAGIAKGTIYLYFQDREDLVLQTADHAFSRLLEALDEVFSSGLPFRQLFHLLLKTIFEFFARDREFFRLYLSLKAPSGPKQDPELETRPRPAQYQTYLKRLEDLLSRAMRSGEIRSMDPSLLALFLAEGINSVLRLRLENLIEQAGDNDSDWLLTMIVDGIGART